LIETDILTQDDLSRVPDVLDVWPNELIELLPTFEQQETVADDASIQHDNHNATGVNKLHFQGIFGKDVKVGIVDTGVWYDHPAVSTSPNSSKSNH
jgi:subtilisin family serine protease